MRTANLTKLHLTNNDLALAWFACAHASAFWRKRGRSKYCRQERAKYDALSKKLDKIVPQVECSDE